MVNKNTALILVDYSKAFDMINHDILLSILKYIGLSFKALHLFDSYLTDRKQSVSLHGVLSNLLDLEKGVPQGSILGPILFTVYTCTFFDNINKDLEYHVYADDTQFYYSFSAADVSMATIKINECLEQILKISNQHCLKLNASKTKFILFGSSKHVNLISSQMNIRLAGEHIKISECVRNLGLHMDQSLRFKTHVSKQIQKAFSTLRILYANREIFSEDLKKVLCESLVLSNFNYCDTVYGPCLDTIDQNRIQKVQNACLRFIYGLRKYDRISYTFKLSGWLNMQERRKTHLLTLVYKIIRNKVPPYLAERLNFRSDVHNINVRYKHFITPPLHRTTLFERSFTYNCATLWNNLPENLKLIRSLEITFRKRLKIYVASIS